MRRTEFETRCLDAKCSSTSCREHWPRAFAQRRGPHLAYWQEQRWHVDGYGIHAGDVLELELGDRQWIRVRVESMNEGRTLVAHFDALTQRALAFGPNGAMFPAGVLERFNATTHVNVEIDRLRWPGGQR